MSTQSRDILKNYFVTNAIPSQGQFADFIDSCMNKSDEGISVSSLQNIGFGAPSPQANVSVKSKYGYLSGTISGTRNNSVLTGSGTHFTAELQNISQLYLNGTSYGIAAISSDTSLTLTQALANDLPATRGAVLLDIFYVQDLHDNILFAISKDGRVGINKVPTDTLDVNGNIIATSFQGNGQNLTNLQAANLKGVLSKDQIPAIDLPRNLSGLFTITADFTRTLTGTVTGTTGQNTLQGTATNFTNELRVGDKIKISDTIYTVTVISGNTALTITPVLVQGPTNAAINAQSDLLLAQDYQNNRYFIVDRSGKVGIGKSPSELLDVNGVVKANGFAGDASGLTNIPADEITGIISTTNLPAIELNEIQGLVTITETYDDEISGTVTGAMNTTSMIGANTHFTAELCVGQKILIDKNIYTIQAIASDIALTLTTALLTAPANSNAYIAGNFLSLKNIADTEVMNVDALGNLTTSGNIEAKSFIGDATGLTNIPAAGITGIVKRENLPALSVNEIEGLVTITEAYDKSISGTVSGTINTTSVTGTNTHFTAALIVGQKIQIDKNIYTVETITSDIALRLTTALLTAPVNSTAFVAGNFLSLKNLSDVEVMNVDLVGNLTTSGNVKANSFTGNATGLVNIPADGITGVINRENLPSLSVNEIEGLVTITEVYDNQISGTVSGTFGTTSITGENTHFTTEISVGQKIQIDKNIYTIQAIASDIALTLTTALLIAPTNSNAFVAGDFLLLKNIADAEVMNVDASGNLTTSGDVKAKSFTGDATGLTNVPAAAISGMISAANLPSFYQAQGTFTINQLFNKPTTGKAYGSIGGTSVSGLNTLFTKELVPGQKIWIANGVSQVASILSDTSLTVWAELMATVNGETILVQGDFLSMKSTDNQEVVNVDAGGNLTTSGNVSAKNFIGNASGLTSISAAALTGSIPSAAIPSIDASKITGTIPSASIPAIDASKITGVIPAASIPSIDASKITGTILSASIPSIDASKITGTISSASIPSIDASKITGVIPAASIPSIDAIKITGTIPSASIPSIDASKISGTISSASIPSIDASKITGTLSPAQLPPIDPGKQGAFITILADKPVLNGEEGLTLSWATQSIDSLTLTFLLDGQVRSMTTSNKDITLQQQSFLLTPCQNSVYTFTGSIGGKIICQSQLSVAVIQNVNQFARQLKFEGYILPYTLTTAATRYQLTTLTTNNLTALATAIRNAGFDSASAVQEIQNYYTKAGFTWDPVVNGGTLNTIFGTTQQMINMDALKQANSGTALPDLISALGTKYKLQTSSNANIISLGTAIKLTNKYSTSDVFQYIPQYYRNLGQPWSASKEGLTLQNVFNN